MNGSNAGIAGLSLCAPCGPATSLEASAYWHDCGLHQLLFGEWPLGAGPGSTLIPEVSTALDDWPCLEDVLREASRRSAAGWLLLLTADALPSAALIRALAGFLASQPRPQLLLGRAWRVSTDRWLMLRQLGPGPGQESAIRQALREEGWLDQPAAISWMLFPSNSLSQPPPGLSSAPWSAAPWLARLARESGWPVLDATWAAPLLRPGAEDSLPELPAPGLICCDGPFPAAAPEGPRLSLLLVDEPDRLQRGLDQLLPAASLPWEVVVRELRDLASGPEVVGARNSALADARGDLVWPLWTALPRLGSIATLLRCFEAPWVDLVTTAFRIGDELIGGGDLAQIRPGSLVLRRAWLDHLGGFPAAPMAERCLIRLAQEAVERGATPHALPLDVWGR